MHAYPLAKNFCRCALLKSGKIKLKLSTISYSTYVFLFIQNDHNLGSNEDI